MRWEGGRGGKVEEALLALAVTPKRTKTTVTTTSSGTQKIAAPGGRGWLALLANLSREGTLAMLEGRHSRPVDSPGCGTGAVQAANGGVGD